MSQDNGSPLSNEPAHDPEPAPSPMVWKVAIYTRSDTGSDYTDRREHRYQLWNCRKEAARLGFEVVAEIHDAAVPAGLDVDRPGWEQVHRLIRSRAIDFVISNGLSPITESWADAEALLSLARDYQVDFISPAPFRRMVPPLSPEQTDRFLEPPDGSLRPNAGSPGAA